ncbi:hypothetical protein GCM10023094_11870 [Rhodococcus olei]|uniref:Immunity protein 53 of polymorphic toxin system n=1 Tax=Rhodococcus olei TaxID=2161675 RepID=A0ABP8NZG0_9NOCA
MTILIQVLEQGYAHGTPWQQRKYQFVDAAHVVGLRLDGRSGVWLDMVRPGESHQLAATPVPEQSLYFLLRIVDELATCYRQGGYWLIGHDGVNLDSIAATRFPLP